MLDEAKDKRGNSNPNALKKKKLENLMVLKTSCTIGRVFVSF